MSEQGDKLRAEAAAAEQRAADSFERCDTDGFLSQWASGITAEQKRKQAAIEDNGGVWNHPALFDLDGKRVRAKLIPGKFGTCWAFCDANDQFTGQFITAFPKREATMVKKGYREGEESVRSKAVLKGRGTGLSGSCWVAIARLDKGYPEDAQ